MKGIVYILLALMCVTCVSPFEFSTDQTTELMVVDGLLTNEQKAHRVTLSLSQDLQLAIGGTKYVTNATVWFENESGNVTPLEEQSEGIYETDASFRGTVGEHYALHIETADGRKYASSSVELLSPVPMDSIYGEYVEMPSTESAELLSGVQFYVDSHDIKSDNANFRYDYQEFYSIRMPYNSYFDWERETESLVVRDPQINECYGSSISNKLLAVSTSGLSSPEIKEFPLKFVSDLDPELRFEYLLIARQYAITPTAYQFYKKLKENNESSGSFFDKQKGTVIGNVSEVGHPETPVLGYFEVASSSMIVRKFLAADFRNQGYAPVINDINCSYGLAVDTLQVDEIGSQLTSNQNIIQYADPLQSSVIVVPKSCSDCRLKGVLEKPQYWD